LRRARNAAPASLKVIVGSPAKREGKAASGLRLTTIEKEEVRERQ